ncbi:MAG: flagellar hook-basal body protein [Eubacteriales bacterium]|nr:flagellar hook-basal body protein [Eubacteriales bacterium]MDD4390114.1 flagellar hook-basal body protein [Eubacteriales bacterium]
MVGGFYSAASGVLNQQKIFDVISNNIANATTPGYKGETVVQSSFAEHMITRLSADEGLVKSNIGQRVYITASTGEHTDFTQGSIEPTSRPFDVAITGEGFFLAENGVYGEVATRNGQFALDEEGYLMLPGVGKILNDGKSPIQLEGSNFSIDKNGVIYVDGEESDALFIAKQEGKFKRVGEDLYMLSDNATFENKDVGSYSITQGAVEKSNVNMAQEMSRIIAGQGNYQSCSQILKIYDKLNEITANQIGRIG